MEIKFINDGGKENKLTYKHTMKVMSNLFKGFQGQIIKLKIKTN